MIAFDGRRPLVVGGRRRPTAGARQARPVLLEAGFAGERTLQELETWFVQEVGEAGDPAADP